MHVVYENYQPSFSLSITHLVSRFNVSLEYLLINDECSKVFPYTILSNAVQEFEQAIKRIVSSTAEFEKEGNFARDIRAVEHQQLVEDVLGMPSRGAAKIPLSVFSVRLSLLYSDQ